MARQGRRPPSFEEFQATELYCPGCRQAMPVRSRLFLVLPEGDQYTYHCAGCGEVLAKKVSRDAPNGPPEVLI